MIAQPDRSGAGIAAAPLDPRAVELLDAGGLIPYLKRKYTHECSDNTASPGCPATASAWRCATPPAWCWTPPASKPNTSTATSAGSSGAREGDALPARTLDLLRSTDCAFFGAITSKPAGDAARELAPELQGQGLIYRSPIVRMRQLLDLYICLRPCQAFRGNPLNYRENIDIVVFRENTEGMYIGVEFPQGARSLLRRAGDGAHPARCRHLHPQRHARRLAPHRRAAFEYAVKHGRKKVTAVHKANVLRATCGVFLEAAKEVAAAISAASSSTPPTSTPCACGCSRIRENYDVIVTTNLFGDILSDLCAQLVGGMGFAYSGNIGDRYAVFEPTHGSAPKYAGLNKVNPLATILAAKMMLEWLGETDKAAAIRGRRGGGGASRRGAHLRHGWHRDHRGDGARRG